MKEENIKYETYYKLLLSTGLILKKHGLPENLTVHSLRHTAASLMIANGTDVATVAGILGHNQVSTTHAFDKNKRTAGEALQEVLEIKISDLTRRLFSTCRNQSGIVRVTQCSDYCDAKGNRGEKQISTESVFYTSNIYGPHIQVRRAAAENIKPCVILVPLVIGANFIFLAVKDYADIGADKALHILTGTWRKHTDFYKADRHSEIG
ncbi:MAG: tyrosine-type recombinase/integrase [Oscillospiraceae bacterium]|nr:tyrosine-type recombinase/integrase [Oscillospiraceae bacterium]